MASKQYIHELKQVILRLHNASAKWVESVRVEEKTNAPGRTPPFKFKSSKTRGASDVWQH